MAASTRAIQEPMQWLSGELEEIVKQVVAEMDNSDKFEICIVAGTGKENLLSAVATRFTNKAHDCDTWMLRLPRGTVQWVHANSKKKGITAKSIYVDEASRKTRFFLEDIAPHVPPDTIKN